MNIEALLANQVFSGVAGAAIVSAVLFQLRSVPQTIWALLQAQFSATLTVYSEQEAFRQIDLWLGRHPSTQKSRRLALTEWWNQAAAETEYQLTAGDGPHVLWEGRKPVFALKQTHDPTPGGYGRRQTVTLTTIGRDRSVLERILREARTVQDRDVVPVHLWGGHGFQLIERRQRRALETIHLAAGLRDSIVEDAQRFISRRAWYVDRGIPHRRGYLFEGPPGTGKSSMALALAGALHRPIYIINPATVQDDNALQSAINQAGSAVVLIEDIDAVDVSRERPAPAPAYTAAPALARGAGVPDSLPVAAERTGISTSGLLNAIDGVAARDGRILIITTNHAEKLDPALIRPGRVDMRCHFGPAGEAEAAAMFRRFCPDLDERHFLAEIAPELPLSQAELQNRLLRIAA
jgi:mitochondrial chaperone BCS1